MARSQTRKSCHSDQKTPSKIRLSAHRDRYVRCYRDSYRDRNDARAVKRGGRQREATREQVSRPLCLWSARMGRIDPWLCHDSLASGRGSNAGASSSNSSAHADRLKRRDVIDADPNSVRKIASIAISDLEAANDCSRTLIGGPVVRGTVNVPIAG